MSEKHQPITDPELAAMKYLCKTSLERAVIPVKDLSRLIREIEELRAALQEIVELPLRVVLRDQNDTRIFMAVKIALAALGG